FNRVSHLHSALQNIYQTQFHCDKVQIHSRKNFLLEAKRSKQLHFKGKTFTGRSFISEVKRSRSAGFSSKKIAMTRTFHFSFQIAVRFLSNNYSAFRGFCSSSLSGSSLFLSLVYLYILTLYPLDLFFYF
ncbi:hypothetical protein PHAVU_010G069200, partial [Phaseolus vulgaris]